MAKRKGRPPYKKEKDKRSKVLIVCLTQAEHDGLKRMARLADKPMAFLVRDEVFSSDAAKDANVKWGGNVDE